eukprot:5368004-Prymnesium_polylepis.2
MREPFEDLSGQGARPPAQRVWEGQPPPFPHPHPRCHTLATVESHAHACYTHAPPCTRTCPSYGTWLPNMARGSHRLTRSITQRRSLFTAVAT